MSNKSEATWHPNSRPEVPHADLIARLREIQRIVEHALYDASAVDEAIAALGDTVPRAQYRTTVDERASWEYVAHRAERERDEARAERDALAAREAQVRAVVDDLPRWLEAGTRPRLVAILNIAPAVSLALHEAEVKAQALDEAAEAFATGEWFDAFATGGVEHDVSAVQATEAWFKARATAIREEAE